MTFSMLHVNIRPYTNDHARFIAEAQSDRRAPREVPSFICLPVI
ncbi:hypothetical protein ACFSE1_19015 [Rhizobium helianthi]|uniref:Antibiotic biosynthesis monooxygenase n=1 Tax=Rhizobium helianthi TaxID=1132695 RepID=A0ABW4M8U6_9HYPH